ncbi:hypothetical protein [Rufibacter sp. LB8]|nr:hypothetical protein [Rufibacter sp. LB8]
MYKILLLAVLMIVCRFGYGQELNRIELLNFYDSVISDYYSRGLFNKTSQENLLLSDSLPNGLRLRYPNFTLKPVTEEAGLNIIESTKGKSGRLNKISLKKISPDTLDLVIVGWGVTIERVFKIHKGRVITKSINMAYGCGGTMGYIPDGRLVYNKNRDKWEYHPYSVLLEKKREKLEANR